MIRPRLWYDKSMRERLRSLVYLLTLFLGACATALHGPQGAVSSTQKLPTAESYYRALLGFQYEQDGNDVEALSAYQDLLKGDPSSSFILSRVVSVLERMGRRQEALSYAQAATEVDPKNPLLFDTLGDLYLATRDIAGATAAYEQAITHNPHDILGYLKLAGAFERVNDLESAESAIRRGVNANPDAYRGHYYLGGLLAKRQAYDLALDAYRTALSFRPSFELAAVAIANLLIKQGNVEGGIAAYREWATQYPTHKAVWSTLVDLLLQEKKYDEVLALLQEDTPSYTRDSTTIDLSELPRLLQMIAVLSEKGDYQAAIDRLLPIVRAMPDNKQVKYHLGLLYERYEMPEKAIPIYEALLEKDGASANVHFRLGNALYKVGRISDALTLGERIETLYPNATDGYLLMGRILFQEGSCLEAVDHLLSGIAKNTESPDLHYYLGMVYDKLGRFDAMVGEMETVLRLDPDDAHALNYLGYTFADKGIRLDDAAELLHKALSLYPKDGYFVDSLGWTYYKQNKLDSAIATLEEAVSLVTDDAVIFEHLGEAYFAHQQPHLAKTHWEKAIALNPGNTALRERFSAVGFGQPSTAPTTDTRQIGKEVTTCKSVSSP